MNAKFLLLFFMMTGVIAALLSSQICSLQTTESSNLVFVFYDQTSILSSSIACQYNVTNNTQYGQANLTGNFTSQLADAYNPNKGTVSNYLGFGFVDVIKLLLTMLWSLTGLNIIVFMVAMGVSTTVIFMIMVPLYLLWIFSIIEFIRGGQL